jgi:hypothetical protein
LTTLAKHMRLDKNSTHHRVRKAIDRGFLVNREEKRGMPARIALAEPLPEEMEILPDPEALECWSSAGGVKKEESDESDDGDATESNGPLLPPDPHSNTPTPPHRRLPPPVGQRLVPSRRQPTGGGHRVRPRGLAPRVRACG